MLLWSFEGDAMLIAASRERTAGGRTFDTLGGHSGGDTPLPFPNREVKPASADGTWGASPRESRTPPSLCARSEYRLAAVSDRAQANPFMGCSNPPPLRV